MTLVNWECFHNLVLLKTKLNTVSKAILARKCVMYPSTGPKILILVSKNSKFKDKRSCRLSRNNSGDISFAKSAISMWL